MAGKGPGLLVRDVAEAQVSVSTTAAISHQITRLLGSRQRKKMTLTRGKVPTAGEATRAKGLCRAPSWQRVCPWFCGAMEIIAERRSELCRSTSKLLTKIKCISKCAKDFMEAF